MIYWFLVIIFHDRGPSWALLIIYWFLVTIFHDRGQLTLESKYYAIESCSSSIRFRSCHIFCQSEIKMESFYKKWLEKNKKENLEILNAIRVSANLSRPSDLQTEPITSTNEDAEDSLQNPSVPSSEASLPMIDFNSSLSNIIFEEGNLQLTIEKGNHIKQKKFRLEDHLFYLRIQLKNPNFDVPLLRDILNFLEVGFDYIITQIRQFYNSEHHNVAFLTLYQQPMINGLNTGGFDIQESGTEIVERILKMLEQFLVSNQTLKLDNTFKVYLKVLSINHMKYNQKSKKRVHRKRTKDFYKRNKNCLQQIPKLW